MKKLNLKKILGKKEVITPITEGTPIKTHLRITRLAIECPSGKIVYETIEDAIKAIKIIGIKKHRKGIHWYKCNDCGYYHLTSSHDHKKRKQ